MKFSLCTSLISLLIALSSQVTPCRELKASHPAQIVYPTLNWSIPQGSSYRSTLKNGLRTYIAEDHTLPQITLYFMFETGSLLDPQGKEGLASLMVRSMRSGGTLLFKPDSLDAVREYFAISFTGNVNENQVFYKCTFLSQYTDTALAIVDQILFHPAFDKSKIEKERSFFLQEIQHRFDNPEPVLSAAYRKNLYPGQANNRLPTEKSVQSLTREDLVDFHIRELRTDNVLVGVAGDINSDKIRKWLVTHFPPVQPDHKTTLYPQVICKPENRALIIQKNLSQAYIQIGLPLFKRPNSDYYALHVFNLILGGESFISRLGSTVRSNEGLTYSIHSSVESNYFYPGTFSITFFTKQESMNRAMDIVMAQTQKILSEGITEQELTRAKKILIEEFPSQFRSKNDIVYNYMINEFLKRGPNHFIAYPDSINSLTREKVIAAARKYINPDSLSLIIVGDTSALLNSPKSGKFQLKTVPGLRVMGQDQL